MKLFSFGTGILALSILLSACAQEGQPENVNKPNEQEAEKKEEQVQEEQTETKVETNKANSIAKDQFFDNFNGEIEHMHGIGYAGNQHAIFVATHNGIKVYENGAWFETKENKHDYMGFTAVDEGFYTSGHPAEGSEYPNPLGLKRSLDNGRTLENLGFEGESDFHGLAVGYKSHKIYVLNNHENSKIGSGLYQSKDDGQSWDKVNLGEAGREIFAIAAHPTEEGTFALSGKNGVFLSSDNGKTYQAMKPGSQGTAIYFTEDALYYGTYRGEKATLTKYMLSEQTETSISLPDLGKDALMYVAQNPKNDKEMVFATFNGDMYLTTDKGQSWKEIVNEGKVKE